MGSLPLTVLQVCLANFYSYCKNRESIFTVKEEIGAGDSKIILNCVYWQISVTSAVWRTSVIHQHKCCNMLSSRSITKFIFFPLPLFHESCHCFCDVINGNQNIAEAIKTWYSSPLMALRKTRRAVNYSPYRLRESCKEIDIIKHHWDLAIELHYCPPKKTLEPRSETVI